MCRWSNVLIKIIINILLIFFYISNLSTFSNDKWIYFNKKNSNLPSNDIEAIAIDKNDKAWIGTSKGLAIYNDNNNFNIYNSTNSGLTDNFVYSIAIGNDNSGYIGIGDGDGGFFILRDLKWQAYYMKHFQIPHNYVKTLAVDSSKFVWLGTFGGVTRFDGIGFTPFTPDNSGISSWAISSIIVDKNNNKWFGSFSSGISKFDGENWTTYNYENFQLKSNNIQSLGIDSKGNLWVGYNGQGISKYDGQNWYHFDSQNSGLTNDYVNTICEDNKGNLWFGTNNSINKFDGTNWEDYNYSSGLQMGFIMSIAVDKYNNLWIGSDEGGLSIFNEDGITLFIDNDDQFKNNEFLISPDPSNDFINLNINLKYSNYKIQIYSLEGIKMAETDFKQIIDVRDLRPGLYYLKIGTIIMKFIRL